MITGASGGIGSACADTFATEGARLALIDLYPRSDESANRLDNKRQKFFSADISDESNVVQLMDQVIAHFGQLDVLVNNAAVLLPTKPVQETSIEEIDRLLAVNVRGTFLCCKHAYPLLQSTRGNVVNISSMAGVCGEKEHAAYAMTKGAINALTKSIAIDWGRVGIRCNSVCPSSVITPNSERVIAKSHDAAMLIKLRNQISHLGDAALPEQIASVVLFLASPAADYMTGAIVPVSGGSECGYGLKY
jgi:NAD(P)-dependent dehydrogenase (short-subunit alcohol dehydrogenase family)